MTVNEVLKIINGISVPEEGFCFEKCFNVLWGKNNKNEIVFAIENENEVSLPFSENTKYLKLIFNHLVIIEDGEKKYNRKISAIVLKTLESKYVDLFITLSLSFSEKASSDKILKYFMELKDLFANVKKPNISELQGMYGELLSMYFLKNEYGIDISNYYQKEDRRKFDFSISDKKKIEIKTTTREERIHHFLQLQLDVERFDIKIISIMLQKDDEGLSLKELISRCKIVFSYNLLLLMHIERMIMNIDDEDLAKIRYNYNYFKDNIRFYNANDIPRIKEKNDEGVYNVEYDVDFTNSKSINKDELMCWI